MSEDPERAPAVPPPSAVTDTAQPALLAGDADRESSAQALTAAVVEGRLTLEEFSDRVALAHTARTQAELAQLTRDLPTAPAPQALAPATARFRAFCSMLTRSGPWELPARSEFRCICGTIVLDLSQARLPAQEVQIDVFNLCGTVTVKVPDGIAVSVEGGGLFASQVVRAPARAPDRGAPRLRITTRGPGGT
ncbi:MAG: DUF1707 SHOCT-like domain-containing protein, partial [Solirubrobacteraceae bacterium]